MLRTLERERSRLLLEEEAIKMEMAEEQSLETLEDNPQIDAMAPATKVEYTNEYPTLAKKYKQ